MALPAIFVLHIRIGCSAIFAADVSIGTLQDVHDDIFDAVQRLIVKEIDRVFWRRQVTIHAIGNNTLRIVYMAGCSPRLVGWNDFMAAGAELRSGCSRHGVVQDAE